MADKLVTIAKFADSIEADLAKQFLTDSGIEAVLTGQNAANLYTIPAVASISLQVFESRAKEALETLESHKKQEQ